MFWCLRFITIEELEQVLREYGMHDGRDIKEIISEIDTDNVSQNEKENGHFFVSSYFPSNKKVVSNGDMKCIFCRMAG